MEPRCKACDNSLDSETELIWHEERKAWEDLCGTCLNIVFNPPLIEDLSYEREYIAAHRDEWDSVQEFSVLDDMPTVRET